MIETDYSNYTLDNLLRKYEIMTNTHNERSSQSWLSGPGNRWEGLRLGLAPLLDSVQHKADVPAEKLGVNICASNLPNFGAFYLWGSQTIIEDSKLIQSKIEMFSIFYGNHGQSEMEPLNGHLPSNFYLMST